MDENVIFVFRVIDSVCVTSRESNEKRGEKAFID